MSSAASIAGWCVAQYLGTVNLFLIRESTSIREVSMVCVMSDMFYLHPSEEWVFTTYIPSEVWVLVTYIRMYVYA